MKNVQFENYKGFYIIKGFEIFDVMYIDKEVALQVEEENGRHKDSIKEGFIVVNDSDELNTILEGGYTMDEFSMFRTYELATSFIDDEMEE